MASQLILQIIGNTHLVEKYLKTFSSLVFFVLIICLAWKTMVRFCWELKTCINKTTIFYVLTLHLSHNIKLLQFFLWYLCGPHAQVWTIPASFFERNTSNYGCQTVSTVLSPWNFKLWYVFQRMSNLYFSELHCCIVLYCECLPCGFCHALMGFIGRLSLKQNVLT